MSGCDSSLAYEDARTCLVSGVRGCHRSLQLGCLILAPGLEGPLLAVSPLSPLSRGVQSISLFPLREPTTASCCAQTYVSTVGTQTAGNNTWHTPNLIQYAEGARPGCDRVGRQQRQWQAGKGEKATSAWRPPAPLARRSARERVLARFPPPSPAPSPAAAPWPVGRSTAAS